ncbi:hypothetical protein G6F33_004243 [Rhizopus arrhizus]|nr:hypothetical protein G6F24_003766 [Rhizopus arrhizus]KAG0914453.1 hypothetical protein G6F33_004243 [Rhizopus arrhizus]
MGSFFSKEKTNSNDFEKILSELDTKIQKAEIKLSELKIRQRRVSFMWIIYSLIVWIVCIVYLIRKVYDPFGMPHEYVMAVLPVVLLPAGIYYVRKGLIYYFDRKQKKEESNLSLLRKEQKEKIEELKKKTSYYTTQSLLERYDDEAAKKKAEAAKVANEKSDLRQRRPVTAPVNHKPVPPPQPYPSSPIPNQSPNQLRYPSQPMIPQQPLKSQPQWYDKLIDALVGDAGPETKYALICTHCFAHNGLVFKEEYDTIQYVCPVCKQFNHSRKPKQVEPKAISAQTNKEEEEREVIDQKESVSPRAVRKAIRELKKEIEQDKENGTETIAARVRQRRNKNSDVNVDEDEEESE